MANIKSAKKRILVNETKAARNKAIRSKEQTAIRQSSLRLRLIQRRLRLLSLPAIRLLLLPSLRSHLQRSLRLVLRVYTTRTTLQERFPD